MFIKHINNDEAYLDAIIPYPERTSFHPKIYIMESDGELDIAFGSFNFTKMGFCHNYETIFHVRIGVNGQTTDRYLVFSIIKFCRKVLSHRRMPEKCREFSDWLQQWGKRLNHIDEHADPRAILKRTGCLPVYNYGNTNTLDTITCVLDDIIECWALAPFNDNIGILFPKAKIRYFELNEGFGEQDTNHAKVFILKTTKHSYALIGSQNATRAAFRENYEFGVLLDLNRYPEVKKVFGREISKPPKPEIVSVRPDFSILWAELDKNCSKLRMMYSVSHTPNNLTCHLVHSSPDNDDRVLIHRFNERISPDLNGLMVLPFGGKERNAISDVIKRPDCSLFIKYRSGGIWKKTPVLTDTNTSINVMNLSEYLDYLAGESCIRPIYGGGLSGGSRDKSSYVDDKTILFADQGALDEAYHLTRRVIMNFQEGKIDIALLRKIADKLKDKTVVAKRSVNKTYLYAANYLMDWLKERRSNDS